MPPTRSPGGLLDERQLEGVALVEWAERLGPALPRARLDVIIDGTGDEPRPIALRARRRRALLPLPRGRRVTAGGPLLVVDTATTTAVIALGTPDGRAHRERSWEAGYRHGEELLTRIEQLLARRRASRRPRSAGSSSARARARSPGLRVGLATVKGLAYALDLPVVGVPTGDALLAAARGRRGDRRGRRRPRAGAARRPVRPRADAARRAAA